MTGTAVVHHDESVVLPEIKRSVAECGYGCSGECMPEHVRKPEHPTTVVDADHVKPAQHVEHKMALSGMAAMGDEIGAGGMNMEAMTLDMRNRFLVSLILAIPTFLYSPLFTQVFKVQLAHPFGLSNEILSFLQTTPAVLHGGWVFYVGAWHGLKNRTLNMAVLVSLSVLAGYLFSVLQPFYSKARFSMRLQ